MNNYSLSVLTLLHYNVVIRDSIEYALDRPNYPIEGFEYKKKAVMVEIQEKTALKNFIDQNKEIGKKITDEINALYGAIYADDSTICKKADKELRVDASQHIAIYDVVLPLHEDVKHAIDAHLGFGAKNNLLEKSLMDLVVADEKMYRLVCFTCLVRDLQRLFIEYNKARNEAKGEITPQSNFVQGELIKIANHIKFTITNHSIKDVKFWDVVDAVNRLIDYTAGRRNLPEGKGFKEVFEETTKLIAENLNTAEAEWKKLYDPAIAELLELSKKNNGQIKVDVKSEEKKN